MRRKKVDPSIDPRFFAHKIEIAIVWPNSAWNRSSVGELLLRLRNLVAFATRPPFFHPFSSRKLAVAFQRLAMRQPALLASQSHGLPRCSTRNDNRSTGSRFPF